MVAASNWSSWAQLAVAIGAVLIAAAVPLSVYLFRPKVELREDESGTHSRVEAHGNPYIRLLASNGRRRRGADGVRVLIDSFREWTPGAPVVTLGSPSLGWPTAVEAADASVAIFPGGTRPVDLGVLVRRVVPEYLQEIKGPTVDDTRQAQAEASRWHFALALHMFVPADERHVLRPNSWVIRLVIGCDGGPSRSYDVDLSWNSTADTPEQALQSVQLAVRRVHPNDPLG